MDMEKKLEGLTRQLTSAFGDRIVSVILYGSAAAGDWQERASDLNILCVLNSLTSAELRMAEGIFKAWVKQGNLPPLLLTEQEVMHSSDCFPIEFHDMQERRRVLLGRDVVADLNIDFSYYRAFVERELRTKQIRLRQKAVEVITDPERLLKLMVDSISTFCALGRHALILGKRQARWKKREILSAISDATGSPMTAANQLLTIRESGKKPAAFDAVALLDAYLMDTYVIVGFVDSLEK
jgi:predicted nucleotidyltransferase